MRQPCRPGQHQLREPGGGREAERRRAGAPPLPPSATPPPVGVRFGTVQDGGPHGAARGPPGAESAAASALPGRWVAAASVRLLRQTPEDSVPWVKGAAGFEEERECFWDLVEVSWEVR